MGHVLAGPRLYLECLRAPCLAQYSSSCSLMTYRPVSSQTSSCLPMTVSSTVPFPPPLITPSYSRIFRRTRGLGQKCSVMSITLKRMPLTASVLEGMALQKYLGVFITCTLSWHKQAEEVKSKATTVLNILQRSISSCSPAVKARAYSCLVRPTIEYASVAWSPHTQRDIKAVESVQRRAARFFLNDYTRESSVAAMLESVGWDSLERRRLIQDMMMFYSINFHGVRISFPADIHTKDNKLG